MAKHTTESREVLISPRQAASIGRAEALERTLADEAWQVLRDLKSMGVPRVIGGRKS